MSKLPVPIKPASALPAVAVARAVLNPEEYLAFEEMVENVETLAAYHGDVIDLLRKDRTPQWLVKANAELDHYDGFDFVADCARQLERFNPKSAYDANGRITLAQASVHIGALIDGFPTKNTPANFVDRLLLEVMATRPSVIELEAACRHLLRSAGDFTPGVGKVVAAIKEQKKLWSTRTMAVRTFQADVGFLREAVANTAAHFAAEKAKLEQQRLAYEAQQLAAEEQKRIAAEKKRRDEELRELPPGVGDRVSCELWDDGFFIGASPATVMVADEADRFGVQFDNGERHDCYADSLSRLLPGDPGFEKPPTTTATA